MTTNQKPPMFGLMQDWPLTLDKYIEHAKRWHPRREVVSRRADGRIDRRDYAEIYDDAMRISGALLAAGIGLGDRVATLAMNSVEHLSSWYGITGIGAVY